MQLLNCFKEIATRLSQDDNEQNDLHQCCIDWLYMLIDVSQFPRCPTGVLDVLSSDDLSVYQTELHDRVSTLC